jgi:hypothetical protein
MSTYPIDQRQGRSGDNTTIVGCPMSYLCSKSWDDLALTADPRIRNCNVCSKPVTLCTDRHELLQAAPHGGCVGLMDGCGASPRVTLGLPAYASDRMRRYLDVL